MPCRREIGAENLRNLPKLRPVAFRHVHASPVSTMFAGSPSQAPQSSLSPGQPMLSRCRLADLNNGTMTMADWTEAEDKMLTYLTETGISARQIATHFSGRSKSSIIGRQHRIGLKVKAMRAAAPSSMPLKPPRDYRACGFNVAKLNKLREEMEAATRVQPGTKKSKYRPADGGPAPLLLDLEDLTDATCKWPVTDGSPFKFCGHEKDSSVSYCSYHQRVAHAERPLRKIARAA